MAITAKRFKSLSIGQTFTHGSTVWIKKSSRTARLSGTKNTWFYFGQNEICHIVIN